MAYHTPNPPALDETVAALNAVAHATCDRALLALVAGLGLRPWEACALRLRDVAADGSHVRPGRGMLRRVVLTHEYAPALMAAVGRRAGGTLLVTPDGQEVSPRLAVRRLDALARAAGLAPGPTLPQLRARALGPRLTL